MLDTEAAHPGAIDEVSPYLQSDSLNDVVDTLSQFPSETLEHALNDNQIKCKRWLIDKLYLALGGRFGTVYVLGGWYGVLPALLLNDQRFSIRRVVSIDIDPDCETVANRLNQSHRESSRFTAMTANASSVQYQAFDEISSQPAHAKVSFSVPNLVINTSCEHMDLSEKWYDRIPEGMLQAYQTNDYFSCDEHVNCVETLEDFKAQVPMQQILYEGTMERRRYSRFMLIGRK